MSLRIATPTADSVRLGSVALDTIRRIVEDYHDMTRRHNQKPRFGTSSASGHYLARSVVVARPADLMYVVDLQRKWSNAVGFLPASALDRYIENGQCLLIRENDVPAGYLIWTARKRDGLVRVIQVAVDPDLLRTTLGTKVMRHLERAAIRAECSIIRLKTRSDLNANLVWPTLGMAPTAYIVRPSQRGLPLIEWTRQLASVTTAVAAITSDGRTNRRRGTPPNYMTVIRSILSESLDRYAEGAEHPLSPDPGFPGA